MINYLIDSNLANSIRRGIDLILINVIIYKRRGSWSRCFAAW